MFNIMESNETALLKLNEQTTELLKENARLKKLLIRYLKSPCHEAQIMEVKDVLRCCHCGRSV